MIMSDSTYAISLFSFYKTYIQENFIENFTMAKIKLPVKSLIKILKSHKMKQKMRK